MAFLNFKSRLISYYMPRNTLGRLHKKKRPPDYIKAWRIHRGLTQREVCEPDDEDPWLTTASLSRIENGKQPYTTDTLGRLAQIYKCTPSDLINRNPDKAEDENDESPMALFEQLDPEQRQQAVRILRALIGK